MGSAGDQLSLIVDFRARAKEALAIQSNGMLRFQEPPAFRIDWL
jgi:hypothetical protein